MVGVNAASIITSIRVVTTEGEPWLVASDVAKVLGYRDAPNMLRRALLEDEDKGMSLVSTPGGTQNVVTLNESGLYAAIFASRRPEAREFKRWVTATVLPAIRKDGGYIAGEGSGLHWCLPTASGPLRPGNGREGTV